MIMFALSGVPIQKQILFTYNGEFDIRDLIISDKNATKITCKIIRNNITDKTIDLSDLPSGVYFLNIEHEGNIYNKRIIKE